MRVSRAERIKQVYRIMADYDNRHPKGSMTTSQVAHKCGIKSSSKFKKLLRSMAASGQLNATVIQPSYGCGYFVDAWQFVRYEQSSLLPHEITINVRGRSFIELLKGVQPS